MATRMLGMKINIIDLAQIAKILIIAIIMFPIQGLSKEISNLPLAIEKASNGESSYQSDLVDYYYNTSKNYNEAIKWCNVLVDNSNARESEKEYANRILGYCAYEGSGRNKSIEDAIRYWEQGVQLKGGSCALSLARIYATELRDSVESIIWYQKAAELENRTAANFLAQLYEIGHITGSNGTKIYYPNISKDISQAAKYYEIYIKKMGYSWSGVPTNSKLLYKLANWYYTGEGNIERNYSKAFNYFNRAIESNENSKADYKLTTIEEGNALWCISVCYRFGRGVEKDELIARRYVKRAAEKGNENAIALIEK